MKYDTALSSCNPNVIDIKFVRNVAGIRFETCTKLIGVSTVTFLIH